MKKCKLKDLMKQVKRKKVILMMKIDFSILKKFHWDGMVNQFHIGYINFMV